MHVTAILLAAGKGSRMNSEIPKQYMDVNGKPVLYYSLKTFEDSPVDDVILVVPEEDITFCKESIIEEYQLSKVKKVVSGGTERYWSVKNGLIAADDADYVLIHDAARPCMTIDMIERSICEVKRTGACTVGVPVKDTIKIVDDDYNSIETPPRKYLWQVQTPQSFSYEVIMEAYRCLEEKGHTDITDDTMIVERYQGLKTKMIMGDYSNIKITTPEDLWIVKKYLKK